MRISESMQPDADQEAFWEDRYLSGRLPWEAPSVCPELAARFPALGLRGGALEIGCGTGVNALWLAEQGLDVVAVDLSPAAIRLAQMRAATAGGDPRVRFVAGDFLSVATSEPGSVDFVFDRGCFHHIPPDRRADFCDRVAQLLRPGGRWLTLCGSRDDAAIEGTHARFGNSSDRQAADRALREASAIRRPGPPKLAAGELIAALEPRFEVLSLQRFRFTERTGLAPLGWSCLVGPRAAAGPA